MTVEIANRLVELRKQRGFSQEELAEKLGLSRQAVSKWERAEASPDTDNLILLSRLYGISLDQLLNTDIDSFYTIVKDTEEKVEEEAQKEQTRQSEENTDPEDQDNYVHVGFNGIHVKDDDSEVHVGWNGIHVSEGGKTSFHLGSDGIFGEDEDNAFRVKNGIVFVNGEEYDYKDHFVHHMPFTLCAFIAYIVLGMQWGLWHPGWLVFFLPPILSSTIYAVKKRSVRKFNYPCLATLIFLIAGLFFNMWYIAWVIFLTIPLFYALFPKKINVNKHYNITDI